MISTKSLNLRLQISRSAPADARREVAALAAHLPDELRADLQLLVSELVANSVRHAELCEDDWIELRASVGAETVRVEVADPGTGFQPAGRAEPRSGLWMLDRIADRWGVVRDGATCVWFEADLEPSVAERSWEAATRRWPETPRAAARQMCRLHGPPDEVAEDRLVWSRRGAFELRILCAAGPADFSQQEEAAG